MGSLIGSVVGGVLGGRRDNKASRLALTGYNYLQDNPLINQSQEVGSQGLGLLGGFLGGDEGQFQQALNNFRTGTGYQDQLQQGTDAITGSAAARGSLNSGATLKALQGYGQGLANQSLMQYLGLAQNAANMGQQSALGVGAAGSSGGGTAGQIKANTPGIAGRIFG